MLDFEKYFNISLGDESGIETLVRKQKHNIHPIPALSISLFDTGHDDDYESSLLTPYSPSELDITRHNGHSSGMNTT